MKLYQNIWLQPVKTIEKLVSENNSSAIPILPLIIFAVSIGLEMVPGILAVTDIENIYFIIPLTIVISFAFVFLIFRITLPFMIRTAGLLWKGSASLQQLAKACAISLIPYALILVAQLIILGMNVEMTADVFDFSIRPIVICWSFVLLVIGVAKAQRFTYGFAILNIILSYIPFLLLPLLKTI